MAHLVLKKDNQEILRVLLDRSKIIIGRGADSHVLLPDPKVSRQHCSIIETEFGWKLVNESEQELLVDEVSEQEAILRDGQVIGIGSYQIVYCTDKAPLSEKGTLSTEGENTGVLSLNEGGDALVFEQAKLVVTSGPDTNRSFELRGSSALIGKGQLCDVRLSDPYVSTEHIRLEKGRVGWSLRDVGSTNGSKVDGVLVRDASLSFGSAVEIGETRMVFQSLTKEWPLPPADQNKFDEMVGHSPNMRKVFSILQAVSRSDAPVLLLGESGTGKELAARAIHRASCRASGPFIAVNSGGISPNLVESELFGHEKGAFTGADRKHAGSFERATGGTLFLDEIGELPLDIQVKLLRVLETGDFRRVGGRETLQSQARIISATHRDLGEMVRKELFRKDLYYRLAVVPVTLPALVNRKEDIPAIVEELLIKMCPPGSSLQRLSISELGMKLLQEREWPGNIRELRNVLQRAMIFSTDGRIEVEHLNFFDETQGDIEKSSQANVSMKGSLENLECEAIISALRRNGGSRKVAAQDLGIARSTLHEKIKKYNIDIPVRKR